MRNIEMIEKKGIDACYNSFSHEKFIHFDTFFFLNWNFVAIKTLKIQNLTFNKMLQYTKTKGWFSRKIKKKVEDFNEKYTTKFCFNKENTLILNVAHEILQNKREIVCCLYKDMKNELNWFEL